MSTNRPFTAATNKLAYAQSFARPQSRRYTEHARGREHLKGRAAGVLQSFARHRHAPGRHRGTTELL